jgi:hypothetical protein
MLSAPVLHTPFVSQQPVHVVEHGAPQTPPPLHVCATVVQSVQSPPRVPQALSSPPMLQTPFASQQPVHVAEQFPPPIGALQTPPLQVRPAVAQFVQSTPWVPQAMLSAPVLHAPFVSQQPVHVAEHGAPHTPLLHVRPAVVQSVQSAPRVPQALSSPPMLQTPFVSQQPVHLAEQVWLPPLEPPLLLEPPIEPLLDRPLDAPLPPLEPPPLLLEVASSPIWPAPFASSPAFDASGPSPARTSSLPPQADAASAARAKTGNVGER